MQGMNQGCDPGFICLMGSLLDSTDFHWVFIEFQASKFSVERDSITDDIIGANFREPLSQLAQQPAALIFFPSKIRRNHII